MPGLAIGKAGKFHIASYSEHITLRMKSVSSTGAVGRLDGSSPFVRSSHRTIAGDLADLIYLNFDVA